MRRRRGKAPPCAHRWEILRPGEHGDEEWPGLLMACGACGGTSRIRAGVRDVYHVGGARVLEVERWRVRTRHLDAAGVPLLEGVRARWDDGGRVEHSLRPPTVLLDGAADRLALAREVLEELDGAPDADGFELVGRLVGEAFRIREELAERRAGYSPTGSIAHTAAAATPSRR